jgi:hypothetical protein
MYVPTQAIKTPQVAVHTMFWFFLGVGKAWQTNIKQPILKPKNQ